MSTMSVENLKEELRIQKVITKDLERELKSHALKLKWWFHKTKDEDFRDYFGIPKN